MGDALDFRDPEWVAEQLNIDKNAVYRLLNEGLLPGLQLGRKWLISESSLVEHLKAEERRQTQMRRQGGLGLREDLAGSPRLDRFSDRARKVLTAAHADAQRRNASYVGQEHLLVAITTIPGGMGHALFGVLDVPSERLRAAVEQRIGASSEGVSPNGEVGVTPRLRRAIELAVEEAEQLGHGYVGVEHLVLGLLAEGSGLGCQVLTSAGLTLDRVRTEVTNLLMLPVAERTRLAQQARQPAVGRRPQADA